MNERIDARHHADHGWPSERIAAAAAYIRARATAARLPVRRVEHPPEEHAPPAVGLLSQVLDAAVAAGSAPVLDLAAAAGAGRELWDAECESWLALPAELPRGRYIALRVSGESMAPLMHSGDTVLVQLGPRLVSDSVIVARRPDDGYVVKRVGRIRRTTIELLSVNPDFPPITIPRSEQLVVGTVVMRWQRASPPASLTRGAGSPAGRRAARDRGASSPAADRA